ncbi:transcriptional regulator, MucR family [Palleronia salina]|uniref:Transcriptional regulator, MucR family n=1 Tax=Palleronia salina TaxID=313368 RepID=A0A1M6D0G9_9RHOB|nr:MucR family transcriptional regulator [Palleronia salina]SHI66815.1 transcriptional regulator, MucR family [Palleronia salina]
MSTSPLSDDCIAIIAAGYAQRSDVTQDQIIEFVHRLRGGTAIPAQPAVTQPAAAGLAIPRTPALPVDQSVTNDKIYCLCCGKGFKMLKRHLGAEHDMTEDEYRAAFNLPASMPLVAPSYSERKAEYARKAGLGTYQRESQRSGRGAS